MPGHAQYSVASFRMLFIISGILVLAMNLLSGCYLRPRQARYQAAPRPELNALFILPSLAAGVQYDSEP